MRRLGRPDPPPPLAASHVPAVIRLNAPSGHRLPRTLIERAVRTTLQQEGVSAAEISVTFLSDGPIRDLNLRWLGHDWVPDVLSFRLHDPSEPSVGDIYVGFEQAARQAAEDGIPLEEELCRLAIHGALHVLGHDHAPHGASAATDRTNDEAMYARQEMLLGLALAEGGADAPRLRGRGRESPTKRRKA
ncbi:MAG: rRNA maturation RNase YbeY [Gemmatimonadetes bacterium]|nr:rRNA maturation RNase YbeY [Gemmatimonadota bacterium]